jgi:hypothetical protein
MNDEDDDSALARRYSAEALRILAEIADKSTADPAVREEARQALEKWLVRLEELGQDSTLSPDVRLPLRGSIQADRQALPSSSHAERPVQGSRRQEYWAADARGPRA